MFFVVFSIRLTGPAFAALSDEEASEVVRSLKVMSRARPTDKQRLVHLLQQHGLKSICITFDHSPRCEQVLTPLDEKPIKPN